MSGSKLRHALTATVLSCTLFTVCAAEGDAAAPARRERESRKQEVAARTAAHSPWRLLLNWLQKAGSSLDPEGLMIDPEPGQGGEGESQPGG